MTAGQDDVWDALLATRERALRVARARCGDPHEAEDCVQEAMARIAAMPDVDLDRIGPLVSTVVANLAVDVHRGRSRASGLEKRLHSVGSVESSPDEAVCDRDEARWLWSLRGSLGEQDRRALELRVAGLTVNETADELGVTYKAAENALGRARKRLRTAWAATAALIGILWGRRPAGAPATALAAAPVAFLAAAALAVLSPAPAPPSPEPRAQPATAALDHRPPAVAGPPVAAPPPLAPADAAGGDGHRAPAAAGPVDAEAAAAPPERMASTEAVEVAEYRVADPVTVERHSTNRTFVEEVKRCVDRLPQTTGSGTLGCPP